MVHWLQRHNKKVFVDFASVRASIIPVLLLWAIVTLCMACRSDGVREASKVGGDVDISVSELQQMIRDQQDLVLIDVRTPEEIADGKIAGALEIDFRGQAFDDELASLDKTKTYVVYCASGRRSSNTLTKMNRMGFEHVYNLAGGFEGYQRHGGE